MQVWLFEDDVDASDWVRKAKSGYRSWSKKVADIREVIAPTPSAFDRLLQNARKTPPDLVVIDLEIDGDHHAGVAAIKRVRELPVQNETPIVVFSSTATRAARDSAYEAGATSYVKKPAHAGRRVEALADIFGYWLELDQRRQ